MERIHLTDVAPRDGLQNQAVHLSTLDKLEFVRLLVAAGVASVEAASFVSPKAVPQMADAADVIRGLNAAQPALRVSALVPNMKGLELATSAGAREIAVVLSATETMNQRNIRMSLALAVDTCETTLLAARSRGLATRAYVAVAFHCPFEGATPGDEVLTLVKRMHAAGAEEIVLADTIGAASPREVKDLLAACAGEIPVAKIGVHFHDTRGMGVANAWAALEAGVRRFDASTGGVGGCPFAPGAAGNVATEDLVLMARQSGFDAGIDLDRLLDAIAFVEVKLGIPLGGRSTPWLLRQRAKQVGQL